MTVRAHTLIDDAAFMQQPNLWPRWPVLPVVSRHAQPCDRQMGVMREQPEPRVYVGVNLWMLESGPLVRQLEAKATLIVDYDSFEACAAEWRVD